MGGGFSLAKEVITGGPLIVLYAINLEMIEKKIEGKGGEIIQETFEFPGGQRFHVSDPTGNILAVWSDR